MIPVQVSALQLLVGGSVFVLVLSLWVGAMVLLTWRRQARQGKIQQRLGLGDDDAMAKAGDGRLLRLWHDGREATTSVPRQASRRSLWQRMERLRLDAGMAMPVPLILLGLAGGCVLVGAAVVVLVGNLMLAAVAAVGTVMVWWAFVQHRVNRRLNIFETQLVDAMELAARSLRAGHPLVGAFRLISEEIPEPVGPLFGEVCSQQSLGASLESALRKVAHDTDNPDFSLFSVSVAIQMRSGGNLADMMDRVAYVIRDRLRLGRRIRVLTAQTQFSKRVLIAVPVLLFVLLNVINPSYMRPLYETTLGHLILLCAVIGLGTGSWIMHRMATLRY